MYKKYWIYTILLYFLLSASQAKNNKYILKESSIDILINHENVLVNEIPTDQINNRNNNIFFKLNNSENKLSIFNIKCAKSYQKVVFSPENQSFTLKKDDFPCLFIPLVPPRESIYFSLK